MRTIANDLNASGVPSPGAMWKRSERRRDGRWLISALNAMLQNERYVGRLVWNKSQWVKDPDSGRRVRRERPEAEWTITECPALGKIGPDYVQASRRLTACKAMQKRRQSMQIMHQNLSAVLFPSYRRRVLGMLLLHPEDALHGREIARRTGLPAGTLTRELKRLADVGLLNRDRRGNQLVYSANRESPIFEELAGILRKTSGLADVVAEALEPVADRIEVAFIFGSVARAAETQGSDIDVLIIGSVDFGAVIDALHPAQQRLAREINPKVFSTHEWKMKLTVPDPFVSDVLSNKKIFLIGDEYGLAELGRHKS